MKITDTTRLGVVLALSAVAGALVYLGKDATTIAAVLAAIVAGANGFLRSPTQQDPTPSTAAPTSEEPKS